MKPFFFIIVFLLGMFQLYSQVDSSSDKAVEFSIGGGIHLSICFDFFVGKNDSSNFNEWIWPTPFSLGISFPVSFIYYINKNLGLGINYTGVFSIIPSYYNQKYIVLENYNLIKFVNKIGNFDLGRFFLLEYGLGMLGRYYFDFNGDYFSNSLLGPHLLIGGEVWILSNNFSYSFGVYNELLINAYRKTEQFYYQVNEYVFNFGVEIRWRYNFFHELK